MTTATIPLVQGTYMYVQFVFLHNLDAKET